MYDKAVAQWHCLSLIRHMFANLLQNLHILFAEYESETENTVIFRPEAQLPTILKINLAYSGQLHSCSVWATPNHTTRHRKSALL